MSDFNKVGLLLLDGEGRILLCRKDNYTAKLILPGGQVEAGESDELCLEREIQEELGCEIELSSLRYVGRYRDVAASELVGEQRHVSIALYSGRLASEPHPAAEIKELVWFGPHGVRAELSPIIRNKIIPSLRELGLISW